MAAYYNEHDRFAAAWLRELIKAGLIAAGDVDERDIQEVGPDDLKGYTQCHFFAGIGVWSYALRAAGWPDDSAVWTGSCPCQSFSASGKRAGFGDQRHLWPAWFRLIGECRPDAIFGEQVATKNGIAWLEVVSADLEEIDYAVGAVPFAACGVGAPMLSKRIYFMAEANRLGFARPRIPVSAHHQRRSAGDKLHLGRCGTLSGLVPSVRPRRSQRGDKGIAIEKIEAAAGKTADFTGEVGGYWGGADWILRQRADGSGADWCPVEPGTFPLAHGAAARVGRLRGYGNALCAPQAIAFIAAAREARGELT